MLTVLMLLAGDPLAKYDATIRPEHRAHWAFRPVVARPGNVDAFWGRTLPPATKRALLRRITLDLTGLPPTVAEQDAFLKDPRPDAYERVVERLLASPRHGERWARYWLDVARYADTNGYERDGDKPLAWKYRDWVIRALNADKPFDRFITEQLAGDEVADADESSLIATGFLRLGPWDDEPADPKNDRFDQLDDVVSTTAEAFLGLSLGCARCHDHKFEPLTSVDYYRMVGVFAPLDRPRNGRMELARPALPRPALVGRDVKTLPHGYFLEERSATPPTTHLLRRGRADLPGPEVPPGVPAVLAEKQPTFLPPGKFTSHRRLSLARWIASKDNPLTARVIVNRVWAWHFGVGLVRTPGDFGTRGERPTHPELLDWLAADFVAHGWSLKHLHRRIVTSAVYRQSSGEGGFPYRRLDAEAIRDGILAVSGRLNPTMYGPGVKPPIDPAALAGHSDPKTVWKPDGESEASRRTVYVHAKRSLLLPLVESLDFCDTTRSTAKRPVTTVAPQALMLFNGAFANEQARHLAERLRREAGDERARIDLAYRLLLCRPATENEVQAVSAFAVKNGLEQACRVLLNLNEFVYPD
jgi:hypothetical protein